MAVKLTVATALQNPAGFGSANVGNRYAIIENINYRSQKLFSEKKPVFKVYREKENYILHFILPSENLDFSITYDVVLRLSPLTIGETSSRVVSNYNVDFFSNSPAFMFTYAYILNKNNWLIQELKDKFSDEVFSNEPKERNPGETFGFEKSIYFCLLYLRNNQLTFKSTLERFIEGNINWKTLSDRITSAERKLIQYNSEKNKIDNAKKQAKKKELAAKNKSKPTSDTTAKSVKVAGTNTSKTNKTTIKTKSALISNRPNKKTK